MNHPRSLIFDSSSLVTASKFYINGVLVIDYILKGFRVLIPEEVKKETVDAGVLKGYADAYEIERRIATHSISVVPTSRLDAVFEEVLDDYAVEKGDREVLRLCRQAPDYDYVVIDDHTLYIIAHRLEMRVLFLPDVIYEMAKMEIVDIKKALKMLLKIKPRYRRGFIEHTLKKIRGVI